MPGYRKKSLRLKRSKTRTRNKSLKNKNKRKTVNKKRKISRKRKTQYGGSAATAEKMMLNIIRAYINTKTERLSPTFIEELISYITTTWSGIKSVITSSQNTAIEEIGTLLHGKRIKNIVGIPKDGSGFTLYFTEGKLKLEFMTELGSENNIKLKVKLLNPQLNVRNPGIIGPIDLFSYPLK